MARIGIRRLIFHAAHSVTDLIAPPTCAFCDRGLPLPGPELLLCEDCTAGILVPRDRVCPRCAGDQNPVDTDNCHACRHRRLRFGRAVALGKYQGQLREAVIAMKRQAHAPLTLAVGQLLAERVAPLVEQSRPDVIAPVPGHWWKRLRRGINTPDLLVEVLGRRFGLPVAMDLLVCCRRIQKQGMLPVTKRWKNVRGAFRLGAGYDLSERRLLVVDDVMTTGATANEIAKVARKAGAAHVDVAVVARGGVTKKMAAEKIPLNISHHSHDRSD